MDGHGPNQGEDEPTRSKEGRQRLGIWRKLLIATPFVVILLVLVMFGAARATEGNTFCGTSCHEMLPYDHTWQASSHAKVDCVTCHIPPGLMSFVRTKLFGLREVYVHLTMGDKAPITVTRKIPNVVCADCHPTGSYPDPVPLVTADFSHRSHASVPACVDCHAQLVHHPLPGVPYIPPQSMNGCFVCHDGKQQPNDCAYCHAAPHTDRGPCEKCHGLNSWAPGNFDHPVPLQGPHAQILCETCHTSPTAKGMGPADGCIDCHGNHHRDPKLTRCADCHTTTHFTPSTFVHPQEGEHIPSGEVPLPCQACHTQTFSSASCSCHGGTRPTGGG